MAIGDDKVRIQTIVDKKLGAKIDELAQRMRLSQSAMAAMLLEAAVQDNEWIIKVVSSNFARKLKSAVTGKPVRTKIED